MKLTTLFRLRKPDGTDPVNIEDFNDNFDVIDEELGKRLESTGAASDMTVAFEQASARTNLKTGEKISVSFGKIMKWFADLKTVAFSGSYNDLTSKPTIPSGAAASQAVANNCTTTAAGSVLDARQGKVLMDKANQLNSELKFPDGTKFYPDIQDGEYGFNTAADRGADTFHPFKADWELVLKITFGAASNNKGGIYSNDDAATDTPHGWYSSMNSTIRCVNGEITVTGECACAGRFGNQNDVAGYISNITVVSFSYL